MGAFTGGSMLHGTTGRTDLLGDQHTVELTHAQYHSVRRLAAELPAETPIHPTHGFGSFCAATPGSGDSSTIAEQRHVNPALNQDEQSYSAPQLADRLDELSDGEVWVHCRSGFRASIAASILDRDHRDVVLVDDAFDNAKRYSLAA